MNNSCPDISNLDVAEALSLAIIAEEEGYRFYSKIMEETLDKRVKNEIRDLRNEEMNHKVIFKKVLKDLNLEPVVKTDSDLNCWVKAEIIEPMTDALNKHSPATSLEALKIGLLLENKSIEMFELLKEAADNDISKKAIEGVLEEEKKHRKRLNIIISY